MSRSARSVLSQYSTARSIFGGCGYSVGTRYSQGTETELCYGHLARYTAPWCAHDVCDSRTGARYFPAFPMSDSAAAQAVTGHCWPHLSRPSGPVVGLVSAVVISPGNMLAPDSPSSCSASQTAPPLEIQPVAAVQSFADGVVPIVLPPGLQEVLGFWPNRSGSTSA